MSASLERLEPGSRYRVRIARRLSHSPERVWRVLTERKLLTQWFPSDVIGDWEVGAELHFVFAEGEAADATDAELRGEVRAVEPGRLLEYRWGSSVLRFELAAEGSGCTLTFSETFEDGSIAARNSAGWELCLANLEAVGGGEPAAPFDLDAWRAIFERRVAAFEPEAGPQRGAPASHPAIVAERAGGESEDRA